LKECITNISGQTLSLIIDGMTSISLPHFRPLPKSIQSTKGLKHSPFGIIDHTNNITDFYLVPEYVTHGPNLTCTILWLHLKKLRNLNIVIPPNLHLQVDNCFKDNKNQTVLQFLALLEHHNIFKSAKMSSLPPGHTHEDIDQRFSRISHWASKHMLLCSQYWDKWIKKCFKTLIAEQHVSISGIPLDTVWNFKELFAPYKSQLSGYSQARYFKFFIQNGSPVMMIKKSLDSPWEGISYENQQASILLFYPTPPPLLGVHCVATKELPNDIKESILSAAVLAHLEEPIANMWNKLFQDLADKNLGKQDFQWDDVLVEPLLLPNVPAAPVSHLIVEQDEMDSYHSINPYQHQAIAVNIDQQALPEDLQCGHFALIRVQLNNNNNKTMLLGRIVEMDAEARTVGLTVWAATDPAKRIYGITDDVKEVSFNTYSGRNKTYPLSP